LHFYDHNTGIRSPGALGGGVDMSLGSSRANGVCKVEERILGREKERG